MKLTALIMFLCLGLTSFAQDWTYDIEEAKTQAKKITKTSCFYFQVQTGVPLVLNLTAKSGKVNNLKLMPVKN